MYTGTVNAVAVGSLFTILFAMVFVVNELNIQVGMLKFVKNFYFFITSQKPQNIRALSE